MVLSLGLYNGAVAVEIVRSGLLGVPEQTVEGARSLGYSRWQTFRYVELPIGLRLSIPTMTSNVVSLIKTSAQAALVAVGDAMYYANQIMLDNFRNLEVMLLVWAIYALIAGAAALAARRIGQAVPHLGVRVVSAGRELKAFLLGALAVPALPDARLLHDLREPSRRGRASHCPPLAGSFSQGRQTFRASAAGSARTS